MNSKFLRICSMILTVVLVINLLPAQALGEMIFTEKQSISVSDESLSADATVESPTDDEPAYIVDEIKERRTEHSKDFRLSNGLQMAVVYDNPVHYENNGEWAEIDNTLMTTTDGTYTNTAGIWEVALPQQMTANAPVTITKDGYTLSFVLAGELNKPSGTVVMSEQAELSAQGAAAETFTLASTQAATAQLQDTGIAEAKAAATYPETVSDKLVSRLAYQNVFANTGITYDLDSNKVKESIILSSYNANLRGYKYTLNVGELIPVLYDDGHIDFFNADKTDVVMVMPAPFLVDGAFAYNEDIQVQLVGKGSTYTLSYILPQSWLADEERQWPVILDPVVAATTSTSNIRDQQVTENTEYSNTRGVMEAGYGANDGIERFFVKYRDLPALGAADVIVYAQINLYKPETSSASAVIEVHEVLETWESEELHWSNKPNYNEEIEDYRVVQNAGTYSWDVTDIARGWYEGENTGMMFKASDDVEQAKVANWKQFYTSDYGVSSYKPTLLISFRNSAGLESYWSYTAASAGRAGTGYVNDHTGNLVWVHNDIGFGGNRQPVSIDHVYNASDIGETDRYGTSPGWKTSLNQRIYPWTDTNYYVWEDGDGTKHYFLKESYGVYKDEDGLELTFTNTGSGSSYFKITDKNGNVMHFDNMRRLRKIENNQETKSSITIEYPYSSTYKISKVTDGAGRVYNYTYNSAGLLDRISYTGTGTTEIAYVAFGYTDGILTSITNMDGETVTYTYQNNLLVRATDIDDYNVRYTYSTYNDNDEGLPSRVIKVEEFDRDSETGADIAGGSMDIEYAHNQTKFTDHNGNVQISQFNDFGNTVSVQDGLGRAQMAQYANTTRTDAGKGNQLQISSKLQTTVNNLFEDHSFENGSYWGTTENATELQHYLGTKALTVTNGTLSKSQPVTEGKTYTFSAWVKTGEKSAYLTLGAAKSLELKAGSDWTRLEVSYTAESNEVTASLVTEDTAYMDCVQLEEMAAASRYNLLENSDFTGGLGSSWTGTGFLVNTATDTAAPHLDDQVLSVTGDPEAEKRLSQTLSISGDKGDSFVLAGWAKGDSVPLIEDEEKQRTFGVEVTFNYTSTVEEPKEKKITFNPDTDSTVSWQYATAPIVAEEAYDSVTVTVTYDYNANTVLFDGIQLFKEAYGSSYTYDEDGNVVAVKDIQEQSTTYEYTNNDLTAAILPSGAKLSYEYDDYHNVIKATSETGQTYTFEYDTYGNNTKVSILEAVEVTEGEETEATAEEGTGSEETEEIKPTISSSATYSADGNRLVSTTDTLGNIATYSYNVDTNVLEWVKNPTNSEATRTNYTYDEMYRMATVAATTDTSLAMSASYSYENDLLKSIATPSTTYSFTYGDFALRKSVTIGSRTLASYSYTDDRNKYLSSLDYGNGDSVQYEYDDYGRLLLETYEDEETVSYQYDNDGVLVAVTDSASGITTRRYFDLSGRAAGYSEKSNDFTHTVGYEYDNINNLTQLVENIDGTEKTTSYTYDEDNRATSITTDGTTVEYTYDSFGRVTQQVTKIKGENEQPDQVILTEYFTFTDPSDTATSGQVATYRTVSTGMDITYTYEYDKNGNVTEVEEKNNSTNSTVTTSYAYDSANQLIREDNQGKNASYTWTYDNAGNILAFNTYAYTTGELGTASASVPYVYGDEEWGDLLTSLNGQTISCDTIGNPISDGTRSYTWQHGRQLATLTENNTTWNYTYNNAGLRTGRYIENGTSYKYVYNGSQLVQMTANGQKVTFTYDAAGTPLTMKVYTVTADPDDASKTITNCDTYYYITNLQGDVMGLTNSAGTMVVGYEYSAYGVLTVTLGDGTTAENLNPLTYRGYVYDSETGLYYLQSRYYDPAVGRFINADAFAVTGQGLLGSNMFAYCANNPVFNIDSTGTNYRVVGGGLQVEIEVGQAVIGFEVIVFQDVKECDDCDFVVAVYSYNGVSISGNDTVLYSVLAMITENAGLLCGTSGEIAHGIAALTVMLTSNYSVSVSGFVVMGNNKFRSTSDYEHSFTTVGGGWGRLKGGVSYSESCYTIAIGVNVVGAKKVPSWGVTKTYYHKELEIPVNIGNTIPVYTPTTIRR